MKFVQKMYSLFVWYIFKTIKKLREGGIVLLPFLGIKFKKKTFLLYYGSIYCPFSQGHKDIWTRLCFETIETFFFIAAVLHFTVTPGSSLTNITHILKRV
jgi:hypothetical protein